MKFSKSLRFRFLIVMSSILAVGTLVTSLAIAINDGIAHQDSLRSDGRRLSSYIALLSQEPLIVKDRIQLDAIVNEANKDEDIAYVFIRDARGDLLTSPYASINYRLPKINAILLESSGGQEFQDIINRIKVREPVIEASAPITMGSTILGVKNIGTVTIGLTEYKMRREITESVLFVIIFDLLGAIILGSVLFIASKSIIFDPLSELAQASSRLAQGDLSTEVGMRSKGEVQTLVDSFNKMVKNLEKVTVSKDYLDNILKNMFNTLIVVSSENKIISTNTATCKLLGYDEKELLGEPLEMITNGENSDREMWKKDLLAGDHISNIEEIYRTKGGRGVPVLLSASVMRDENHLLRGIIYVAQDITERKRAENLLKKSEVRLRYLAAQLLEVQEQERKRLSMDLHDDLGQSLLVLRMQLNSILRQFFPEPPIRQGLEEASNYLVEIINKVRHLSHSLSPTTLENLGLAKALRGLLNEFQKYHDISIEADLDEVDSLLSQEAHIGIYRIIQEFLSNVHKHAEAQRVKVSIKARPKKVAVALEDDGKGFVLAEVQGRPHKKGGLGLLSMEERVRMMGGQLSLTSQKGQGTHLYFELSRLNEEEALETEAQA